MLFNSLFIRSANICEENEELEGIGRETVLSSANSTYLKNEEALGKSFIKIRNNNGPRTDP